MNEFMRELNAMKSTEFWHKFIQNSTQSNVRSLVNNMSSKSATLLLPMDDTNTTAMTTTTTVSDSSSHVTQQPSIADQVYLCRKIAKQLVCDESNAKSKGRQMFERVVEKCDNWVTTGDDDDASEHSFHERTITAGAPNLRLLFDPRHVQDLNSLSFESNEKREKEFTKKCKEFGHVIVEDLNSPEIHPNKGNVLFAKRQQKSDEWIVSKDDEDEEEMSSTTLPLATVDDRNTTIARTQSSCGAEMWHKEWLSSSSSLLTSKSGHLPSLIWHSYAFRDFNSRAKPFQRMY